MIRVRLENVELGVLMGKTLVDVVRNGDEEIIFYTEDGRKFKMHHRQDCCEDVRIEDVCGDLDDLVGSPVLVAEKVTHDGEGFDDLPTPEWVEDTRVWTFYKFATNKGSVDVRWFGSSNGYYSEGVDFDEITS